MNNRLPPSRSEDTLLLQQHSHSKAKTHSRSHSSTITKSVSASTPPFLSVRPPHGGSRLGLATSATPATSMHSLSSDDSTSSPDRPTTDKITTEDEDDLVTTTFVPAPSSGILQVYAAYETGLASGTSFKLHVTPWTTAREVVDLVVKQLNMAVVPKGKDGPIYPNDKLRNFCLVAVIGARERCLRDDFKPLQLQNPWKKGRLYVRQKHVLAALEQSARHTAYI
ncbi:hypothetical protein R5R35_013844 [Gryllus longicercus]|uniref:Ras-associating domain-containing protein n=1 Tax=Gryllus longicercus TaxID=2509291 RepID=A0AAN9VN58_9ORTH